MNLLSNAEFWVGVAFLLFSLLLIRMKVPAAILGLLDSRAQRIQEQLDEAEKLRNEAQTLLAQIKTQREDAEKLAAEIVANAKSDAERAAVEAETNLQEQIKRRAALAERKIANAEAQAAAEVKAAAAELAAQAAEAVLAARLASGKADPIVDRAIGELGDRLQ
ncbi:MAG: ATP F0F1 synthase subunit B [Caulobacteraceae bacterium]